MVVPLAFPYVTAVLTASGSALDRLARRRSMPLDRLVHHVSMALTRALVVTVLMASGT